MLETTGQACQAHFALQGLLVLWRDELSVILISLDCEIDSLRISKHMFGTLCQDMHQLVARTTNQSEALTDCFFAIEREKKLAITSRHTLTQKYTKLFFGYKPQINLPTSQWHLPLLSPKTPR